jgi:hypothetical protein
VEGNREGVFNQSQESEVTPETRCTPIGRESCGEIKVQSTPMEISGNCLSSSMGAHWYSHSSAVKSSCFIVVRVLPNSMDHLGST